MFFNFIILFGLSDFLFTQALSKSKDADISRNRNQLLQLIKLLNSQNEKRISDLNDRKFIEDLEKKGKFNQYKQSVDNQVDANLKNILRLIQKNYDAHEKDEERKIKDPGIVFIANPEVLEEYKAFHSKDPFQKYSNQIRRQTHRSSGFASSSSSSSSGSDDFDEAAPGRRTLKKMLQDLRRKILPSSIGVEDSLTLRRRKPKAALKRKKPVDSIEKEDWKENVIKPRPKKRKDSSQAFDDQKPFKDVRPKKRPAAHQPPKETYDSYKPRKESYNQRKDEYRSFGRTSIPIVGKKSIYEKK